MSAAPDPDLEEEVRRFLATFGEPYTDLPSAVRWMMGTLGELSAGLFFEKMEGLSKVQDRTRSAARSRTTAAESRNQRIIELATEYWDTHPWEKRATAAAEVQSRLAAEGVEPLPSIGTIEKKLRGLRAARYYNR